MDDMLASAKKEVLVEMIKLVQKRGMTGTKGGWKEFLNFYDKKIGASLSDPARRPIESLVAFLKTFDKEDDMKFLEKVLECHSNRDVMEQHQKKSPDSETPEQKLVRATLEHPRYPIEYSLPSHEEGWMVTKRSKKSKSLKSTDMIAVDCEMVLCEDGTEALVKVCVVDRHLQVKLDELVKPNKVVSDYRTEITGIAAKDLEDITYSLADVQKSLGRLLSNGTILVGHSLNNDLRALQVDHSRVIDTSYVFKFENERPNHRPSLYNLCKSVLGFELRKKGSPHNCLDDAVAAMKLVLAKIGSGVDDVLPSPKEEVQDMDLAKLLLHRISINVPSSDLHSIIPGDFSLDVKAHKIKGDKYSAFAIFKSQQEANEVFNNLEGIQEKDSFGRPQKTITFKYGSNKTGNLYVRKMADDNSLENITSKKRPIQDEEALTESKKLRITQTNGVVEEADADCNLCESRLKEIESLKKELSERDKEITSLNKIVVALTRKQGL